VTELLAYDDACLVHAAAGGDRGAWAGLVDRFGGLIWRIARSHRLNDGDAADVSQTTWLRLLEHIDRLDDPSRVGAWLATTARRESLRVIGLAGRQTLLPDGGFLDSFPDDAAELDAGLLADERRGMVDEALSRLTPRCQTMLRMLMEDNDLHYQDLAAMLNMPIGSIGPTRARCLRKLRVIMEELERQPVRTTPGA
jgi:RNA polymerase sigma factor (sigma-70 family)